MEMAVAVGSFEGAAAAPREMPKCRTRGCGGRLIANRGLDLPTFLLSAHALAWNASAAGCATRLGSISIQSSAYR
jgi:hypothetical protein